jgi:hypothetical protein
MKKVKLSLCDLSVESFQIDGQGRAPQGTVRAQGKSYFPEECTWYGPMCGTTAAPGELCACIQQSVNTCETDGACYCPPTPYC